MNWEKWKVAFDGPTTPPSGLAALLPAPARIPRPFSSLYPSLFWWRRRSSPEKKVDDMMERVPWALRPTVFGLVWLAASCAVPALIVVTGSTLFFLVNAAFRLRRRLGVGVGGSNFHFIRMSSLIRLLI